MDNSDKNGQPLPPPPPTASVEGQTSAIIPQIMENRTTGKDDTVQIVDESAGVAEEKKKPSQPGLINYFVSSVAEIVLKGLKIPSARFCLRNQARLLTHRCVLCDSDRLRHCASLDERRFR